jgi:anti-sigma-K factor RskA
MPALAVCLVVALIAGRAWLPGADDAPIMADRLVTLRASGALAGMSGQLAIGAERNAAVLRDVPDAPGPDVWQAWAITESGAKRSVATITRARDLVVVELPADAVAFAVTREPSGGSEQPTTDPLLFARLA